MYNQIQVMVDRLCCLSRIQMKHSALNEISKSSNHFLFLKRCSWLGCQSMHSTFPIDRQLEALQGICKQTHACSHIAHLPWLPYKYGLVYKYTKAHIFSFSSLQYTLHIFFPCIHTMQCYTIKLMASLLSLSASHS